MAVLQLVKYQCLETVRIVKALLALALQGKTRGAIICYMDDDGQEHTMYTGYYASGKNAASASMRMGLSLMRANGEID